MYIVKRQLQSRLKITAIGFAVCRSTKSAIVTNFGNLTDFAEQKIKMNFGVLWHTSWRNINPKLLGIGNTFEIFKIYF